MSRTAAALAGALVLAVIVVVTVVVVRTASEPPAQSAAPRPQQDRQEEPAPEPRATVVSGTSPEAIVIGEIYAQSLDRAGFAAQHEWGGGALSGPVEALEAGDVTVGFSDTGAPLGDAPDGIEMLVPSPGARSEHVVVATRATTERYGLEDVADLPVVPGVRVASTPASEDDPLAELWPLLAAPAGEDDFRPSDASEAAMLLREGEVDAAVMESFEGRIVADDLVVLSDERQNLVADGALYPAPVARTGFLAEHPDARGALEGVSKKVATEDVRGLVAETEADGGDPSGPVENYYEREVGGG